MKLVKETEALAKEHGVSIEKVYPLIGLQGKTIGICFQW